MTKNKGAVYCDLLNGVDLFMPFDVKVRVLRPGAMNPYRFWGCYHFWYTDEDGIQCDILWYNDRSLVPVSVEGGFEAILDAVFTSRTIKSSKEVETSSKCAGCVVGCDLRAINAMQPEVAYRRPDP
jgi:hypothetical protein